MVREWIVKLLRLQLEQLNLLWLDQDEFLLFP